MFKLFCKILLLFILFTYQAVAIEVATVNSNTTNLDLSNSTEIYFDSTYSYNYDDVSKNTFNFNFGPLKSKSILKGYTKDAIWIRFSIENSDKNVFKGDIEVPIPLINSLDIYTSVENNITKNELTSTLLLKKTDTYARSFFIPIELKPLSRTNFYIRAKGNHSVIITPTLYSEKESKKRLVYMSMFNGVLIGIIFIMLLHNLNTYIINKDENYLYYILYLIGLFFFMGIYYGYNFQLFWNDSPKFHEKTVYPIIAFSFYTALLFTRSFLNTSREFKKVDVYLALIMYAFVPFAFLSFFITDYMITIYASTLLVLVSSVGLVYISIIAFLKKKAGSFYILLAWILSIVSLFISSLMLQGFIECSDFVYEFYAISIVLHILLLSFALVSRMNFLRKQNQLEIDKDNKIINNLKKSKEELKKLYEKLERKVEIQEVQISHKNKEFEKITIKDELTGLYNRVKLMELINNELHRSKRYNNTFSILLLNIDNL